MTTAGDLVPRTRTASSLTITVRGSGFDVTKGIYVAVCDTGAATWPLTVAGVVLVLLGGGLLVTRRRRTADLT